MTPLPKPAEGQPCNGCGLCCIRQVCEVGFMVFGKNQAAPCPGLLRRDGRYWCKVVLTERQHAMPPLAEAMLGIGDGCDTLDEVPPLTPAELPP